MSEQAADVRAAMSAPSQSLAMKQTAILFGLLLAVQFAAAVLMPGIGERPESYEQYLLLAAFGATFAWPPLLAIWAVFGPQRAAVRLPLAMCLAAAIDLAALYGLNRNYGARGGEMFFFAAAWLFAFAALQAPLWLIRAVRRWRLERAEQGVSTADMAVVAAGRQSAKSASQFSLRAILGWTLAVALLLAAYRAAAPLAGMDLDPEMAVGLLLQTGMIGLLIALGGLPVVALAWIVLADGRRLVLRSALSSLILLGVGGVSTSFSVNRQSVPEYVLAPTAGAVLNGLLCLCVVRACGYQLRRRSKRLAATVAPIPAAPAPISPRRFAFALAPLVAITAGLAYSIPHRQEMWRQVEIEANWRRSGLEVTFDDEGQIIYVRYLQRTPITDEICRRIARVGELRELVLTGSMIDDRQFALLSPLSRLERLEVSGTAITNQGLEQVKQFPLLVYLNVSNAPISDAGLKPLLALSKLEELELSLTDISDEGLSALERLPALRSIDAQLTAVTAQGAERFRQSHPQAKVKFGASDALLGSWQTNTRAVALNASGGSAIGVARESIKVKRLHARGSVVTNGAPAGVTDAGLAALTTAQTELEELDLRESMVTDQGVLVLRKLTTLRRLDLRGSLVTEQGAAKLARVLPECEILR